MKPWAKREGSEHRLRGRAGVAHRQRIKLRDGYQCQRCGMVTQDLEIDHIVPLAISQDDSDDNQQSLCVDCHALKTAVESRSRTSYLPEWLAKPLIPVHVVCGPPGSGKSTHVKTSAIASDLILDADEIASKLSGRPIYQTTADDLDAALRYRNTKLGQLSRARLASQHTACWLVVTASTRNARRFWTDYAGSVTVLDPGPEECIRRIKADTRRPEALKLRQCEAARTWERGSIERIRFSTHSAKGCDASGVPASGWLA